MQIDMYYIRSWRVWVIRVVDEAGNQVGECQYSPNKKGALQTAEKLMEVIEQ